MERLRLVVLVALVAGGIAPLAGQQAPRADSLLERMAGRWVLRGTIEGQPTTHDVAAEWVLGHEYLRLSEVSRERAPAGGPAYEAIVFLGPDPGRPGLACLWLDTTAPVGLNGQAIGHADPSRGDSIRLVFFGGTSNEFHTTFAYDRVGDRWHWLMEGRGKDGKVQPFAQLTMTRSSGAR